MKHISVLVLTTTSLLLAACGASNVDDINSWMSQERNQARPRVAPLPAPKQFVPELYRNGSAIEPFSNQKLTQALKRDATQQVSNGGLVAPELVRRKEHLEDFPLDSMRMVGSIVQGGQPVALISVERLLYQVKLGNYLGQNYGRVTKINETGLTMREIVQDTGGEWIERVATLELQEKSK